MTGEEIIKELNRLDHEISDAEDTITRCVRRQKELENMEEYRSIVISMTSKYDKPTTS
jgi:hypothetical protein